MSRFSPSGALRSGGLALADGSLTRPALRFRHEPGSGLYRNGTGRLALGVNRFRALEATENDVFVRSNGTGSVSPLAFARANATSADGQETRLDAYELATVIGRLAAYRQTATKNGWKLYGSTGGVLSATPDLTVTADGDLTARGGLVGTSLGVGSGAIAGGSLNVGAGAISGGAITGTSLAVGTGTITGGAITGTSLGVGTGAISGASLDVSGGASGLAKAKLGWLTQRLGVGIDPTGLALGAMVLGDNTSKLAVALAPTTDNDAHYLSLNSHKNTGAATGSLRLGLAGSAAGFLGGAYSGSLYTTNGDLILGTNSTARLTINATTGVATFASGLIAGSFQVIGAGAGGITVDAAASQSSSIRLNANNGAVAVFFGINGSTLTPYGLGAAVGDTSLYTSGGALILGTNGVARLTITGAGAATFSGALTAGGLVTATQLTVTSPTGIARLDFNAPTNQPSTIRLNAHNGAAAGFLTLEGSALGLIGLGSAVGDLSLYTSGGGALILGTGGTPRLSINGASGAITTSSSLLVGTRVYPNAIGGNSILALNAPMVEQSVAVNGVVTIPTFPFGAFWIFDRSAVLLGSFTANSLATLIDRGSDAEFQYGGADPGAGSGKVWLSLSGGTLTVVNRTGVARFLGIIGLSSGS